MNKRMIVPTISFLLANFIYQWFQHTPDYVVATERVWFQLCAILFFVFYAKLLAFRASKQQAKIDKITKQMLG